MQLNKYKSELAKTIYQAQQKLFNAFTKIPLENRQRKTIDFTGGKASVSDIIAYQIGWGKLLISWYEAGIRSETPEMPGEGFTTWNYTGLAHHFYKKYAYASAKEQEQVFRDVVNRIIKICETEYKTGNLDMVGVWAWCRLSSGKEWPLSKWVTVNTVAPYKRAAALLKKNNSK